MNSIHFFSFESENTNSAYNSRIKAYKNGLKELNIQSRTIYSKNILNMFIKFLKEVQQIEIIHIYGVTGNRIFRMFILGILSKIFKKKIFLEQTEFPFLNKYINNKSIYKVYLTVFKYIVLRFINGIIVISKPLYYLFKNNIRAKQPITIINMLVDFHRFQNIYITPIFSFKYIAYCGNMNNEKDGILDLIKSYSLIYRKIEENLVLIGPFPDKKVKNYIHKNFNQDLRDRIIFTGEIEASDIPRYLNFASVLVLMRPSNIQSRYGFPTKLGEYLATGRPVLVTRFGDIEKFLIDKKDIFISCKRSCDSFADDILKIIKYYNVSLNVALSGKYKAQKLFNYKIETNKMINFFLNSHV